MTDRVGSQISAEVVSLREDTPPKLFKLYDASEIGWSCTTYDSKAGQYTYEGEHQSLEFPAFGDWCRRGVARVLRSRPGSERLRISGRGSRFPGYRVDGLLHLVGDWTHRPRCASEASRRPAASIPRICISATGDSTGRGFRINGLSEVWSNGQRSRSVLSQLRVPRKAVAGTVPAPDGVSLPPFGGQRCHATWAPPSTRPRHRLELGKPVLLFRLSESGSSLPGTVHPTQLEPRRTHPTSFKYMSG